MERAGGVAYCTEIEPLCPDHLGPDLFRDLTPSFSHAPLSHTKTEEKQTRRARGRGDDKVIELTPPIDSYRTSPTAWIGMFRVVPSA